MSTTMDILATLNYLFLSLPLLALGMTTFSWVLYWIGFVVTVVAVFT